MANVRETGRDGLTVTLTVTFQSEQEMALVGEDLADVLDEALDGYLEMQAEWEVARKAESEPKAAVLPRAVREQLQNLQ